MSTQADIPALLRFLTQTAKIPLATAITLVKPLQSAALTSPSLIAASSLTALNPVFPSQDDAKKVFNAAKRVSKRAATDETTSPRKRRRVSPPTEQNPEQEAQRLEASLTLPESIRDIELLAPVVLFTNRAPLLLAFTFTLLKHTMPKQPLSSRLSLAQAVVSEGARKKAISLGIEKGDLAEDQGWGAGQPTVRVMGREIRIARRAGYPLAEVDQEEEHMVKQEPDKQINDDTAVSEIPALSPLPPEDTQPEVALWALDLEALRKSNNPLVPNEGGNSLPIYSPQSARAYLLKSFASPQILPESVEDGSAKAVKGKKPKSEMQEKEKNLGFLLGALELLFESWTSMLQTDELGRRAWSWYTAVRPDVEHGPAGWGGKGEVRLQQILDLKR